MSPLVACKIKRGNCNITPVRLHKIYHTAVNKATPGTAQNNFNCYKQREKNFIGSERNSPRERTPMIAPRQCFNVPLVDYHMRQIESSSRQSSAERQPFWEKSSELASDQQLGMPGGAETPNLDTSLQNRTDAECSPVSHKIIVKKSPSKPKVQYSNHLIARQRTIDSNKNAQTNPESSGTTPPSEIHLRPLSSKHREQLIANATQSIKPMCKSSKPSPRNKYSLERFSMLVSDHKKFRSSHLGGYKDD